ncbi:MAG: DUF861 domain-containing protein [Rhodobacteraceae bacterium]|nr:DUF861 domain-containing protein [Paracoccaceae bacterium]
MIDLLVFKDLAAQALGPFGDKPTTLTEGQQEAATILWTSADETTKLGVWECTPGHFTADRTKGGEYCHIIAGRASVTNADGNGTKEVGPGDLLVLPQGWTGEWIVHEPMRKLFVIDAA